MNTQGLYPLKIKGSKKSIDKQDYHVFECFACGHNVWRFIIHPRIICFGCMAKVDKKQLRREIQAHRSEYKRYQRDGRIEQKGEDRFVFKDDKRKVVLYNAVGGSEEEEP